MSVVPVISFSDFVAALAILAIVYTITDYRYKFRLAVVPRLRAQTFVIVLIVGILLLVTDLWVAERWPIVDSLITEQIWRAILGAIFLWVAVSWIYYAAIRPMVFGKYNARQYAGAVYSTVMGGAEKELNILADELQHSAPQLVRYSRSESVNRSSNVHESARQVMGLIAHNRLCKHVATTAPLTAMAFVNAVTSQKAFDAPVGDFIHNVSIMAIEAPDSLIHHEDQMADPSLIGYWQPFTESLFGDFNFVESISKDGQSVLDTPLRAHNTWRPSEVRAYSRAIRKVFVSYAKQTRFRAHPYCLFRALSSLESFTLVGTEIDPDAPGSYYSDPVQTLDILVRFLSELLNELSELPRPDIRCVSPSGQSSDILDSVVALAANLVSCAGRVSGHPDGAWMIHYNIVWSRIFSFEKGWAWSVVRLRLRRLIRSTIKDLDQFHFVSASYLAVCLNVGGLRISRSPRPWRSDRQLLRYAAIWAQRNFLELMHERGRLAEACLRGGVSLDETGTRLVKVYGKSFSDTPTKNYLDLQPRAPK